MKVVRVVPYSAVQLFAYEAYKVIFCIDHLGFLEVVNLSPSQPTTLSCYMDACYLHLLSDFILSRRFCREQSLERHIRTYVDCIILTSVLGK